MGTTTGTITLTTAARLFEPQEILMPGKIAPLQSPLGHIASQGEGSATVLQRDRYHQQYLVGILGFLDFLPNLA